MSKLDLDLLRSASHRSMAAHLSGPFGGGAHERPLVLNAEGQAVVEVPSRQPLVVVAPREDLGPLGFQVSVKITIKGQTQAQVVLRFEPFTEAGAFLPAFHPDPLLPEPALVPPMTVEVTRGQGARMDVPVAQQVEVRLVEGVMGRLLYALGAEKQRIRRQARELFAMRRLEYATGNVLDRLGVELGVPRFEERLTWDVAKGQPGSETERESDMDYSRRLAIYRPFLMATPREVLRRLNGPGEGAVNTGPLAGLGLTSRFSLLEANTEFAVGIWLVGPKKPAFLEHLRHVHLLSPAWAKLPEHRLLPQRERARQEAMLARLRASYTFPEGTWLAPGVAAALDQVGLCRVALGVKQRWGVLRAQSDSGGSRYELGLGVEVVAPQAAELTAMVTNLQQGKFAAGTDVNILNLLQSLKPLPVAEDPVGHWLLAGCGLRTVHQVAGSRYYLSHVPIHGLVVSGEPGPEASLAARLHAPGDTGLDSVLFHALRDVEADAAAGGATVPWARVPLAGAPTTWAQAVVPPAAAVQAFAAAGLRTPSQAGDVQRAVANLGNVPPEMTVTLTLEASLALGLLANKPAAVDRLKVLVASMKRREVVSVLPLVIMGGAAMPPGVALVVGATALPELAVTLNPRREDFRWYRLPVNGEPGTLQGDVGPRTRYVPHEQTGLAAVVAVTLVRRNRADPRGRIRPFEAKLVMNEGARMDLLQYEFLMNLLDHVAPLGVVVDTRTLREEQVDPGGQGQAVPLTGLLARNFRAFRQHRNPGERDINTVK
jgi:hypothetical protein